jgi:hypothetical protein
MAVFVLLLIGAGDRLESLPLTFIHLNWKIFHHYFEELESVQGR